MSRIYTCCVCKSETPGEAAETAQVRSNVRAFRDERFTLWRCGQCRSIHAADEVDLDAYYAKYPFFGRELDSFTRMGYRRLVRRLRRAGLKRCSNCDVGILPASAEGILPASAEGILPSVPENQDAAKMAARRAGKMPASQVIDYGCGSGLLVQYLRETGHDAVGYDPYSDDHGDPAVLEQTYHAVIAQDVIEHDADPLGVLARLDALAKPGGIIAIGTPNAAGIDLARPEAFVHPLHQPYHRHIVALPALLQAGRDLGWSVERTYTSPYTNMPVISLPFLHHLMRRFDGCIDVLFDRPAAGLGFWLNPVTWFYLAFGYFLCDDADIVAIFRKP